MISRGRIESFVLLLLLLMLLFFFVGGVQSQQQWITQSTVKEATFLYLDAKWKKNKRSVFYARFQSDPKKIIELKIGFITQFYVFTLTAGDPISLRINPNQPEDMQINSFFALWLPYIIGLLLLAGSFGLVINVIYGHESRKKLKQTGRKIMTSLVEIKTAEEVDAWFKCMRMTPRNRLVCKDAATNPRLFKSDVFIGKKVKLMNQEIPVYIDIHNAEKYYVDLSAVIKYAALKETYFSSMAS